MLAKHELRSRYRLIRSKTVSLNTEVDSLARLFADQAKTILKEETGYWASYKNINSEASPDRIVEYCDWLNWVYPRLENEGMSFYQPLGKDSFEANEWGILEPIPQKSKLIKVEDITGAIIPGVAFDRFGNRLGQGKGFYDKAFNGYRGLKIGLAFTSQIVDEKLPVEAHDALMDMIITEEEIIKLF